jgi:hypothetical protein
MVNERQKDKYFWEEKKWNIIGKAKMEGIDSLYCTVYSSKAESID